MDYERLPLDYYLSQISRIDQVKKKILDRDKPALPGRTIPDEEDLIIGTGRQLNLAILFLDLCGFSKRPSSSFPEQNNLLEIFNLFFSEIIKITEDYGGTVEKNTGDGLMAYFEDNPSTYGTACQKAVSCSLTLMYTTSLLINPAVTAMGQLPLTFRIGIDYGSVTVAKVGAAKRFGGLVAIGSPANIASKILDIAEADDIVIGENVYRLLPSHRQKYCILLKDDTGWIYVQTRAPYRFFKYTGRWTGPLIGK